MKVTPRYFRKLGFRIYNKPMTSGALEGDSGGGENCILSQVKGLAIVLTLSFMGKQEPAPGEGNEEAFFFCGI